MGRFEVASCRPGASFLQSKVAAATEFGHVNRDPGSAPLFESVEKFLCRNGNPPKLTIENCEFDLNSYKQLRSNWNRKTDDAATDGQELVNALVGNSFLDKSGKLSLVDKCSTFNTYLAALVFGEIAPEIDGRVTALASASSADATLPEAVKNLLKTQPSIGIDISTRKPGLRQDGWDGIFDIKWHNQENTTGNKYCSIKIPFSIHEQRGMGIVVNRSAAVEFACDEGLLDTLGPQLDSWLAKIWEFIKHSFNKIRGVESICLVEKNSIDDAGKIFVMSEFGEKGKLNFLLPNQLGQQEVDHRLKLNAMLTAKQITESRTFIKEIEMFVENIDILGEKIFEYFDSINLHNQSIRTEINRLKCSKVSVNESREKIKNLRNEIAILKKKLFEKIKLNNEKNELEFNKIAADGQEASEKIQKLTERVADISVGPPPPASASALSRLAASKNKFGLMSRADDKFQLNREEAPQNKKFDESMDQVETLTVSLDALGKNKIEQEVLGQSGKITIAPSVTDTRVALPPPPPPPPVVALGSLADPAKFFATISLDIISQRAAAISSSRKGKKLDKAIEPAPAPQALEDKSNLIPKEERNELERIERRSECQKAIKMATKYFNENNGSRWKSFDCSGESIFSRVWIDLDDVFPPNFELRYNASQQQVSPDARNSGRMVAAKNDRWIVLTSPKSALSIRVSPDDYVSLERFVPLHKIESGVWVGRNAGIDLLKKINEEGEMMTVSSLLPLLRDLGRLNELKIYYMNHKPQNMCVDPDGNVSLIGCDSMTKYNETKTVFRVTEAYHYEGTERNCNSEPAKKQKSLRKLAAADQRAALLAVIEVTDADIWNIGYKKGRLAKEKEENRLVVNWIKIHAKDDLHLTRLKDLYFLPLDGYADKYSNIVPIAGMLK